jgi:D-alanyl-D-alanine carboxypeptidase/D-alanyl-D-alanine-endopeptidase (penicillin-binding protein 4)
MSPLGVHQRSTAAIALLLTLTSTGSAANLETRIDQIVDASPLAKRSFVGIQVVSLDSRKALYSRNADKFFVPASNMKLFTTALALNRLGGDHHFVTKLITDTSGNLILAGGGDPSLSGRDYPYQKDPSNRPPLYALEQLVDGAIAAGLQQVEGDVIGDDTLYPWVPYPPNWSQSDALGLDGAPVSALTLNENVISLRIRAGENPGDAVEITPWPEIEYFDIDNRIVTGELKSTRHIEVSRKPGSRQLLLSGSVPAGSQLVAETVAVDDPALFAACALYDMLTRKGVTVHGIPLARHRSPDEPLSEVPGREWALRSSPPLSQLLQVVNKVSQNLHAELVLREVGRVKGSGGSRESGMRVLDGFLREIGAPPDEYHMDDGSGLSRNAEVTPRLINRLLAYMWSSPQRDIWMSLLPVGGEDGSLSHRLCCSQESRSILAKTGTLSRVVALSGYADSKTQGHLAFSILINNYGSRTEDIQAWVDKIALGLLE